MKTSTVRVVAVTLGLCGCTGAHAQNRYASPARWDNFHPASQQAQDVGSPQAQRVPSPSDRRVASPTAQSVLMGPDPGQQLLAPPPTVESIPVPSSPSDMAGPMPGDGSQPQVGQWSEPQVGQWMVTDTMSPYSQVSPNNCGVPLRPPISPWFGSADWTVLTLANTSGRPIASGVGAFATTQVDPDTGIGFDVSAGRYLKCGLFGFGVTYTLWNPSSSDEVRLGTIGTIVSSMPAYNAISLDAGTGVESAYAIIDGSGAYTGAAAVRVTRDLLFQGFEANLFSFGLMGARRASRLSCPPDPCQSGCQHARFDQCKGYGGSTGPMIRPRSGRVRVMTSHGFRWFQVRDEFELAYNTDVGSPGYQADDLYEDVDVENNLFGYQFGGMLTYCLNCRTNLNVGAKLGIYGNNAQVRHRVGTRNTLAYRNGVPGDVIDTDSNKTSLASLGEIDFGIGYRLCSAWTMRGGYRMFGITGVATSIGSLPTDYTSVAASGRVRTNDSYVLHGCYFGATYNW